MAWPADLAPCCDLLYAARAVVPPKSWTCLLHGWRSAIRRKGTRILCCKNFQLFGLYHYKWATRSLGP